jgi:protein-L-isoaspartate O-methyltransferase
VSHVHGDTAERARESGGTPRPRTENQWHAYWDRLEEHVIFRVEAADYVARLEAALGLEQGARVLDFGCGFGFVAELLALRVAELYAFDASDHMQRRAQLRLASHANVRFLGRPSVIPWPAGLRFDLILVNSVVQYMPLDELQQWLARWRAMLAPGGRLVLSDLLTQNIDPLREVVELLVLSARRGCLMSVVRKALGELRQYTKTRRVRPLSQIAFGDLRERAGRLGLAVDVLPSNLTYKKARATAVLSMPATDP